MMMSITALIAGVLAFLLTPVVKKLAVKIHAVDDPQDERRMHTDSVPLLGGLTISVSLFAAVGLIKLLYNVDTTAGLQFLQQTGVRIPAVLISYLIIVTLGIVDDIVSLRACFKFPIQVAVALLVVFVGGLRIDVLSDLIGIRPGFCIHLGWLSYPVTIIWILALTNGFNFIDGIDGLACGTGCISSFSLVVVSLLTGNLTEAVLFAALGGACFGFLPYNVHPAKVFMGDTGSTALGFAFGILSIPILLANNPEVPCITPVLLFGLPLFDLCYAVIRRMKKGVSPFQADRGHFHHRLIDRGFSVRKTAAFSWGITALECSATVVSVWNADVRPAALLFGLTVLIVFCFYIIHSVF